MPTKAVLECGRDLTARLGARDSIHTTRHTRRESGAADMPSEEGAPIAGGRPPATAEVGVLEVALLPGTQERVPTQSRPQVGSPPSGPKSFTG